jgi:hypothetical protein
MATDAFEAVPEGERQEKLQMYAAFLRTRDGEADHEAMTLAHREAAMQRYRAPTAFYSAAFDSELFHAQYRRFDPRRPLPRQLLLLLTLVKINAAEAYGVRLTKALRNADDVSPLERLITLEEHYHTQLLLSAAAHFGLTIDAPSEPTMMFKGLIGTIARVPPVMFHPLVLMSEIIGTVYFHRLIGITREVLRDEPVIRDAIEERITEVLIDEIGHVSYNRLLIGSAGMRATRALMPMVALSMRNAVPEYSHLAGGTAPLSDFTSFALQQLPEEIRRRAFVA